MLLVWLRRELVGELGRGDDVVVMEMGLLGAGE